MAKDFRASQIQTTQIIASGSSGTNARIVVYPVEKQSSVVPNQGIIDPNKFGTGSIGSDIFLYVSGGINERNTNNNSITVFGGDISVSGSAFFHNGLTGALNVLPDNNPFIVTTNGLSVSTGSNGQVVISGNPMSASVASDISNNTTKLNFVSSSLFFPKNVLDNTGDRTLSDQDSGRVIFMNGTTTNLVRIPPTLSDGFNVILVQSSSVQVVVKSTASLKYPSITFNSASAEQNSMLFVYSGSSGIFLAGDMEII